jgi:hypothetical protein
VEVEAAAAAATAREITVLVVAGVLIAFQGKVEPSLSTELQAARRQ